MKFTPALVQQLNPSITDAMAQVTASKLLAAAQAAGIDSPRSFAALVANIMTECKLVPVREDMYYTKPDALRSIWPSIFNPSKGGRYVAEQYTRNPAKLGNLVYANRGGNGTVASGDGFNYRGGGFIQITFRNGYRNASFSGVDLEAHPELIEQVGVSAIVACHYWTKLSNANILGNQGLIAQTRVAVNGIRALGLDEMLGYYKIILGQVV